MTSISEEYNYNKSAHIYSYKYGSINNFVHFFLNSFVKTTKLPFVAVGIFILVLALNSIQYSNNDKYFQNKVKDSISTQPDSASFNNILLYIYDTIGINGFSINGIAYVLFFILTYICVALIEMNIGHIKVFYFLVVCFIFQYFERPFSLALCQNDLYGNGSIGDSKYCCGSFIFFASLGFVLFIIQKHISNLYKKFLVWFIIGCVLAGCVLYDYFDTYDDMTDGKKKTCSVFLWHASNFVLGIFSGLALAQ